jgi:excisionase family DNA binding protein
MNIKALKVNEQADKVSTILNLAEAAKLIRVSEKTLGAMARDRRIPAQKVGREWRFLLAAIEDWLMGKVPSEKVAENGNGCEPAKGRSLTKPDEPASPAV